MKCTPTTYRILAGLLVVLLVVLAPLGRTLEALVVPLIPPRYVSLPVVLGSLVVGDWMFGQNPVSLLLGRRRRWPLVASVACVCLCFQLVQTLSEWSHIVLYALLGACLLRAQLSSPPWIAALTVGACIGMLDEGWQSLIPGRFADPWDILLNGIGLSLGVHLSMAVAILPDAAVSGSYR